MFGNESECGVEGWLDVFGLDYINVMEWLYISLVIWAEITESEKTETMSGIMRSQNIHSFLLSA